MRNDLIPNAIEWFTGDASGFEEDEEEGEEEGGDDDTSSSDEEDNTGGFGSQPTKAASGKSKQDDSGTSKPSPFPQPDGSENPECKQS